MDNASLRLFDRLEGEELKKIPARIKYIRKEILHLTQKELAELLNISQAYLSEIESGNKAINAKTIYNLYQICNISPHDLLDSPDSNNALNQLKITYQLTDDDADLILWYCSLPSDRRTALFDAIQVLRASE